MADPRTSSADAPPLLPERHSVSGDAARRYVENRARRLTPAERSAHQREFNARLVELIRADRLRK